MAEITLQYLKPIWIAALRHRGVHEPAVTDATWQELILWASPQRLLGRSSEARGVGMLWDDPRRFNRRERRYDVGVPILPSDAEAVEAPGFVLVTAPGRYLRAAHYGAYDRILETYDEVCNGPLATGEWTLLAQPIIEVYRNSPSEVEESELLTDIYFPAAKL